MSKKFDFFCPVCNAIASFDFDTRFIRVAQCSNAGCRHRFALFPAENQGIHEHDVDNFQKYSDRNISFARYLMRNEIVTNGARILDVGAGLGHISNELKKQVRNIEITCVEAAPSSISILKELGFKVFQNLSDIRDSKFDLIMLIELIEHVEDPIGMLSQCRSLLAPGGQVLLTTPSGKIRRSFLSPTTYDIPEHIQFFDERSLQVARRQAGFELFRILSIPEFYIEPRNLFLKHVKRLFRNFRDIVLGRHHIIAIMANKN